MAIPKKFNRFKVGDVVEMHLRFTNLDHKESFDEGVKTFIAEFERLANSLELGKIECVININPDFNCKNDETS